MKVVSKNRSPQLQEQEANKPRRPLQNKMELQTYEADSALANVCYAIIRPPRLRYDPNMIVPRAKTAQFNLTIHHVPFELSLYLQKKTKYVILYLHGNSSSKMEGFLLLDTLPQYVGLACFDFSSCGNRPEEKFLTLGKDESKQVDVAARYLKNQGYIVVGWGRSMGAVSLLLSEECDVMITDSPFSSLGRVCKESGQSVIPSYCCCFFACFYPCLFCCIRSKIQDLAGLNIDELDIVTRIRSLNKKKEVKKICFVHGVSDNLINKNHSQLLYNEFEGKKKLLLVEGSHNGNRQQQSIDACIQFIDQSLEIVLDHRSSNTNQARQSPNFKGKHEFPTSLSPPNQLKYQAYQATLQPNKLKQHQDELSQNVSNKLPSGQQKNCEPSHPTRQLILQKESFIEAIRFVPYEENEKKGVNN